MSNPKLLNIASSRSKQAEQSNLIKFVDKLPHIMKQDKILLRKRIRQGDLVLFEILSKKNIQFVRDDQHFKKIQVPIRKYLNEIKQAAKTQQITRYKNNINSSRSSCQKFGNKQNLTKQKKPFTQTIKLDNNWNPKPLKSPTHSLEKLNQIKNLKNNTQQSQKLDNIKTKHSLQKLKIKNLHATIQLKPKSQQKYNKTMTGSLSTKNILSKDISFDPNQLNCYTQQYEGLMKCNTERVLNINENNQSVNKNQFNNIFTPPDILRQCRLILQQAKMGFNKQKQKQAIITQKLQSNTFKPIQYLPFNQIQKPQNIFQSNNGLTVSFSKQQHNEFFSPNNQLPKIKASQVLQQQIETIQKVNFQTKTVQQIMDYIFTNQYQIDFNDFSQIVNKLFYSPQKLYRIFKKAEVKEGNINIYTFSKYLQQICKPQQNYVKDIFQLLDMDRKGYITQANITNFVKQIIDPTYENQQTVKQMFMKVLYESDFKNNGKIEYWALYYIKNIECFKEMVVYISQFQFQVEC